jgi:hypothetical protein
MAGGPFAAINTVLVRIGLATLRFPAAGIGEPLFVGRQIVEAVERQTARALGSLT